MFTTNKFYTVTAHNMVDNIEFKASYMDAGLAFQMLNGLCDCEDCHDAVLMDATTGEILGDMNRDYDEQSRRCGHASSLQRDKAFARAHTLLH